MKEYRDNLIQMQQAILDSLEEDRGKSASAVTHEVGDDVDHASEERDREFYQLLAERDQHKLKMIRQALLRIDDGTYGECEECGESIQKARLLALPFTRLCVECKNEEERTKGTGEFTDLPAPRFPSMDYEE